MLSPLDEENKNLQPIDIELEETIKEKKIGPNEIQYEENANSKENRKQKLSPHHNNRSQYAKKLFK